MERKKFKLRRKEPDSFFSNDQLRRTKHGMQASVDKLVSDVNNYMIPRLRDVGYDGRLIRSEDLPKRWKEKEHEKWSAIHPRLLLKDQGWWLEVWPIANRRYKVMLVKPFVIESLAPKHLGNRPRLSIPNDYLEALKDFNKNIWIRSIWNDMFILDLHFLIMTKTGLFWMDKYCSIPNGSTSVSQPIQPCGWYLTYKNDPNVLNRIAVKADYQIGGKFESIKKQLKNTLLTHMYFWCKNNEYHASR